MDKRLTKGDLMDNIYKLTKTIEFLKGAKQNLQEVREIKDDEYKLLFEIRDLQKEIQFIALYLDDSEDKEKCNGV